MTLDEAIKHCEEIAEQLEDYVKSGCCCDDTEIEDEYFKCAEEHRQLAEWLIELKKYREKDRYNNYDVCLGGFHLD